MKQINYISLFACWIYLAGNIIYDILESKQESLRCEDITVDYSMWYFIPQSAMILALIYAGKKQSESLPKIVQSQWLFFFCLALSQLVKNTFFDAIHFALNEYWYMATSLIFTIYKHEIHRRNN